MVAHKRVAERKLDPATVFYSLGRVARELDRRSFSFFDYARVRDELIRADRRRNGEASVLDELMPTADQINTHHETWNAALAAAGLEPFAADLKRGMPIPEAYDLMIAITGKAPGRRSFDELRARVDVSVERFPVGKPSPAIEQDLRDDRSARGLDTPNAPLREADWAHVEILDGALGAAPRKTGRDHWTYERCLLALSDYLALPRVSPSQADYQSKRKQHGWPPVSAIQRQATWSAMIGAAACSCSRRDGAARGTDVVLARG